MVDGVVAWRGGNCTTLCVVVEVGGVPPEARARFVVCSLQIVQMFVN